MTNNAVVTLEKENGIEVLTIKIPVQQRPSASGKTLVVASTNGNHATGITINGKPVILGLNAYIK